MFVFLINVESTIMQMRLVTLSLRKMPIDFSLAETWLSPTERYCPMIASLVPPGHTILHVPRALGVGIIHKTDLKEARSKERCIT